MAMRQMKYHQRVNQEYKIFAVGCFAGFVLSCLIISQINYARFFFYHSRETSSKFDNYDPTLKIGWNPIHVFYGKQALITPEEENKAVYYAQVHQDVAILDLIGKNGGYFIDLAANDAKEFSNTLTLEQYGWNGLCIEPNPVYWYGLSQRKCTVVGALVGGTSKEKLNDQSPLQVKFRGVYGGIMGKMDEKMANYKKEPDASVEYRYTTPLSVVFQKFNVPSTIDYLSLDVEGAEYLIMKDFPFNKYKVKVLTIERPSDELKKLLNNNDYLFLKDLAWWGETLWAHKSMKLTPESPKVKRIPYDGRN